MRTATRERRSTLSELELVQRVLLAFGAIRIAVFGQLSETAESALCDAGAEVVDNFNLSSGMVILCVDCSEQMLSDAIARACDAGIVGMYLRQRRSDTGFTSLEQLEERCFSQDLRKHPAYYRIFRYVDLEQRAEWLETVLEPLSTQAAVRFPMTILKPERDLHMDMLREAGRRSDAHVARYQWASGYIRPNDVVLDAACGLGYGTYVMRHASRGSRFIGVDASDWAIDYAHACFEMPDTEYKKGFLPDALQELPDNSVDVIVSFETFEHVVDPAGLILEFRRILRPAGRLIASVPNDWSDETGEDPNPHHLHVYTWNRLARELGEHFILENATRQIASACKRLDAVGQWTDRPRTLESVEICHAARCEAEWWLAVAMKSPLDATEIPYIETVHDGFQGKTHLIDFAANYTNPWLLHGMVEIPYRMQNPGERAAMALSVLQDFAPDSAEYGAALAVLAYCTLSETPPVMEEMDAEKRIGAYLSHRSINPHVQRWQVSLTYVRARLHLRKGQRADAVEDFLRVATWDVSEITPTLGTKVADAAVRAGMLLWSLERPQEAREVWRNGLSAASRLLQCDWNEWVGNDVSPLGFAMNDAVELVDRAAACAQALAITHRPKASTGGLLFEIERQSLRSAVGRLDSDLKAAWRELHEKTRAHDLIARLSISRLDHIHALEARLAGTDAALAEVTQLSMERLAHVDMLDKRLAETDMALNDGKRISLERLSRIHDFETRLSQTDRALYEAQRLSLERLSRIQDLETRLSQTDEALTEVRQSSLERLSRIHDLETRLSQTDNALAEAQQISLERLDQNLELDRRLTQTNVALDETKALSLERLGRIEALERQLAATNAALDDVSTVSLERLARIEQLESPTGAVGESRLSLPVETSEMMAPVKP
jgi:2-polyprenyl-3-methyl-5-hydroxy-6-metoxy-1,4-benzoquinol methylase